MPCPIHRINASYTLLTTRRYSTAITITDPLVKYQTAVASGLYSPDPAQHRLARHLHKIYLRIKDYSPQVDYRQRLNQVALLTTPKSPLEVEDDEDTRGILALRHHAIWRNPLFRHLLPSKPEDRDSLALTRVLASHQAAIEIDSPKGLFLSGEVGTGKSMLLDLLLEGLPTGRKRRWHFNTFMLYTFSQLESYRRTHGLSPQDSDSDYSLLWMAKDLVDKSPILFLDEFQLPDRAASKILSHLFIAFFQLGGVIIASSNRMPEELQKATGVDYAPGRSRGLMGKVFGWASGGKGELYGESSDFANFLDVLKARCDFWQMEGSRDWRRRENSEARVCDETETVSDKAVPASHLDETRSIGGEEEESNATEHKTPRYYHISSEAEISWRNDISTVLSWPLEEDVPWAPSSVIVYGRSVDTPRHYRGFVYWNFKDLVESFGPADYITMASTYHTFIIEDIPVLTILQKNEARRFITLLDCLYEAKCKLILRADASPDNLFFPEQRRPATTPNNHGLTSPDDVAHDDDATYSETISEVYQDQMSPFRPNVSYYDAQAPTAKYNPDQDSDFGLLQKKPVDFAKTGAFTGEDERFAYKRATSRLWELCSAKWHLRDGDWWQPLPAEARHWEGTEISRPMRGIVGLGGSKGVGEKMGESMEVDEVAGLSKWRVRELKAQSGE